MPAIAIIDDRKSDRETIARVVNSTLKKMKETDHWSVVFDGPPPRQQDVIRWLDENDATVLVSDWKLNEGAKSQRVVNYEADRLIHEIRIRRKNFPIYVITGFESEARAHLKDVENIFNRKEFTKNAETYVTQMIRAGLRRYDEQRELLGNMDSLARKVAGGKSSSKDKAELKSLQGYFQTDLAAIVSLDGVLAEFEQVAEKADKLRQKVERRVTKKTRAK
jgi:hypothetical protein